MSHPSARLEGFRTDFRRFLLRTITRTAAFGASAALALAALTGCAGAGPQSVTDACSIVEDGMTELQKEFAGMTSALESDDIKAIADNYAQLGDRFKDITAKVTNEEVKPLISDMSDGITVFSEILTDSDSFASAAGSTEFTDAATKMTEAGAELGTLCKF